MPTAVTGAYPTDPTAALQLVGYFPCSLDNNCLRSRPVDPDVVSLSVAYVEKMIQQDDRMTGRQEDRKKGREEDRMTG